MINVLKSLSGIIEVERVKIDYEVFRLHHTFTVLMLLVFTIVISTRQFVGDPIQCEKSEELPSEVMNTYCWIHTTYVIPEAFNKKVGVDVPYPGIDATQDESKFRYILYYQWVAFMLLFQAALFYSPRWLWLAWEGGKLGALLMNLDIALIHESEKEEKKYLLVDYLMCSWNMHDWYARKYVICELLCLLNVIGQMFLLDRFFENQFMTYGIDVINYQEKHLLNVDPMIKMFPRVTKCMFMKYGASGNVERYDAICVMALNAVNDKVYLILWFWFIILGILTSMQVLYHVMLFTCPVTRFHILCRTYGFDRKSNVRKLVCNASFGDWFLIFMLGKNMDFVIFRDLVHEIARRINSSEKSLNGNQNQNYRDNV